MPGVANSKNSVTLSYERYLESSDKKQPFFPTRVTVELTNNCNLKCKICPRNYLDAKLGFIKPGLFKKIIDEMALFSPVALVPFFRGESLLHPEFINFMKYAKKNKQIQIQLATNGTLLDKKISEEILQLGIDFISFSFNSLDKGEFKKSSDCEGLVAKINYFIDRKKALNLKLPQIQVSAVKTQKNRQTIDVFTAYWADKADRVRLYQEHSHNGDFGRLNSLNFDPQQRKPCFKPLTDMVIYWDGSVGLCNHDWQKDARLGVLGKTTIAEVWNSPQYHQIRMQHYNHDFTSEPCKSCDQWRSYYLPQGFIGELYSGNRQSPSRVPQE